MCKSNNIEKMVINVFFYHRYKNGTEAFLSEDLICKKLKISIYELKQIIEKHYAEMDRTDISRLMWTQVYPNSYTLPQKQSFIDFIVKKEHVKLQKSQLKENKDHFERGVAV